MWCDEAERMGFAVLTLFQLLSTVFGFADVCEIYITAPKVKVST